MNFTAIDLSKLPAPAAVEELDYEVILQEWKDILLEKAPDLEETLQLESEPIVKLMQCGAFREFLLRQRFNDALRAVMLPFSVGSDLDVLGAFYGATRLVVVAADLDANPVVEEVLEEDDSFRERIQLAMEAQSTAGPTGAYLYHTRSASADVKSASVQMPADGQVLVRVLSRTGDGTASQGLRDEVEAYLNDEDKRPLTDQVIVQSATIYNYTVDADIYFFDGPDRALVLAAAQKAIEDYTVKSHKAGRNISLSGIYAALEQEGVSYIDLNSPMTNVNIDENAAAYCTSITLTDRGVEE